MSEPTNPVKVSKASAYYQARPMLDEYCGDCRAFMPPQGKPEASLGLCFKVEGQVNAKGWCTLFTKKGEGDV